MSLQTIPTAPCVERVWSTFLHHPYLYAVAVFLIAYVAYQRYLHPLRRFPGPFFASLTILWRISKIRTFEQARIDHALHKKYGPVFRDGPNSLTFADPRALEPIYGVRTYLDKAAWYMVMDPDNTGEDYSVFSSRKAEQHRRLRKRIARTYSMTSIMEYEPVIDRNINDLLAWLKKLKTLDVSVWIHYFVMDAMSEMAYGQRMGFLVNGTDVNGYRKALHESVFFLASMGHLTTLSYITKSRWLSPYLGPTAKDKSGYGHMIGMTQRLAEDLILNGNTTGKRFMSHDFYLSKSHDGTPISKRELVGEMIAFTTAGSDPTTYTIVRTLSNICRYPSVRAKLLAELQQTQLETSREGVVTYSQTTRLPYLLAVVKETVRHSPAIQGQFLRVSPPEGIQALPGVFVPGGVSMSTNNYVIHRDPKVFGEDAEEFVPERWLPIGGERYSFMAKHMATFGYGSAACLGKNIAMLKINKAVVEILRRFEFELAEPDAPISERNIVQMFSDRLDMTFTERENKWALL